MHLFHRFSLTASLSSQTSRTVPLNLSLDSQIRQIALERDTLLKECQNLQDQLDSGIGGAGGSCSDFSSNNPANSSKYTRFYKKTMKDAKKMGGQILVKLENEVATPVIDTSFSTFKTVKKSLRRKAIGNRPKNDKSTTSFYSKDGESSEASVTSTESVKDDNIKIKVTPNTDKKLASRFTKYDYTKFLKPASHSSLSDILKDPLVEHHMAEVKREAQREIADYKLRYHKAEQDIASLQATSNRQLGQVTRYKEQSEHYEAAEDNLKAERRKLTRENGQLKERVEELEITRDHLEKRFEKLRAARHLNNI